MEFCPLACGVMLRWAQLLSAPLQHGLRFLHHPLPADPSASLAARFPMRETYGLTTFHISNPVGDLGSTYTPEVPRARQGNRYALVLTSYHFGPGVSHDLAVGQYLAPVLRDDACGGSHLLAISPDPSPFTAWYWQLTPALAFGCPPFWVWVYYALQGTLFQRLRTPWALRKVVFPMTHALVGYRWRNIWLHPKLLGCNNYLCDFVSQNKGVTGLRFGFG